MCLSIKQILLWPQRFGAGTTLLVEQQHAAITQGTASRGVHEVEQNRVARRVDLANGGPTRKRCNKYRGWVHRSRRSTRQHDIFGTSSLASATEFFIAQNAPLVVLAWQALTTIDARHDLASFTSSPSFHYICNDAPRLRSAQYSGMSLKLMTIIRLNYSSGMARRRAEMSRLPKQPLLAITLRPAGSGGSLWVIDPSDGLFSLFPGHRPGKATSTPTSR